MSWLLRWAGPRLAIDGARVCFGRRRLFILPTGAGLAFAALLLVLLLVAMNYNNSMVFAFTFLLGGIGANAMWQTHRNLLGLCVTLLPCGEIFAQGQGALRLQIEPSGRPRRALEIALDARGTQREATELTAATATRAVLALPELRRGLQPLPAVRIATRYPLGLFRAWTLLPYGDRVLVYPRPAPHAPPLPSAPADAGGNLGVEADETDFDGLRPYRPSDPPRRIAWRASARSGELLSREPHAGGVAPAWLAWDALPGRAVEERLSILCRWVLDADRLGLRYGLRLPRSSLAPSQGPAHRRRCLRLLALYGSAS